MRRSLSERPPKGITRDQFLVWRAPRTGRANPHRLTNPVWQWLARTRKNAYQANALFEGPSSLEVGPGFCVDRFGQSQTALPDGRLVHVGGEHEDSYDPDFHIYNDVIVTSPSGDVELFGYPPEVFPPTDFHSATLVGERVIVVGCLGYPYQRVPSVTPVFALDTRTFAMTALPTAGDAPGWLFRHEAQLAADGRTLRVRGGERLTPAGDPRENFDEWSLDLRRLKWKRLTKRRWPVWELTRADGERNRLFELSSYAFDVQGTSAWHRAQAKRSRARLGFTPDLVAFSARYSPPLAHAKPPAGASGVEEERYDTTVIVIDGVPVRYVEGWLGVQVTVCGDLPRRVTARLVEDARQKLGQAERTAWVARRLPPLP